MHSIEELRKIEVFKNISEESLEKIYKYSDVIKLGKNRCLYSDRQILEYVYFVLSGKVTLSKNNENGESKVIFILGKGDIINQPIMRKNTSAVECWGFEDSRILKISFRDFQEVMKDDYELVRNCMIFMETRIRRLYRQLKNSVSINMDKKLATKLYRIGLKYGVNDGKFQNMVIIKLDLTVTYIAKMLGCQRETASRAMKSLAEKSIIKMVGRNIYVNLELAKELFKS